MVLLATPTALTFSVIAFHVSVLVLLVTLWFPFSFFGIVSGMLFRMHVYSDTEKIRPSLPSQCFNHRQPARIAVNFRQYMVRTLSRSLGASKAAQDRGSRESFSDTWSIEEYR